LDQNVSAVYHINAVLSISVPCSDGQRVSARTHL
jgi:hypothetical protein